jgi:3-dehydroquinate synthase
MTGGLSFRFAGFPTEVSFLPSPVLPAGGAGDTVTVFDSTTHALFGEGAPNPVVFPAGEGSKSWGSAEGILERCAAAGLGRDGTVVGVGGGVVCDLAAFAASLYMRGCRLTLVPTTLLAMVDASLGGKTGVDFSGLKNLVGTFYPASRILVSPSVLAGLPEREYLSGLAEVIKTAIIGDPGLLTLLEGERERVLRRDAGLLEEMVRRCLAVKGRIVEADPREEGIRAVLNLGHTFGHALESRSGFSGWTHGEAVAWGMGRAVRAAQLTGETDGAFAGRILGLLRAYGYRLEAEAEPRGLVAAMGMDKKRRGGRVRLVLPRAPGDVVLREAAEELLLRALSE